MEISNFRIMIFRELALKFVFIYLFILSDGGLLYRITFWVRIMTSCSLSWLATAVHETKSVPIDTHVIKSAVYNLMQKNILDLADTFHNNCRILF